MNENDTNTASSDESNDHDLQILKDQREHDPETGTLEKRHLTVARDGASRIVTLGWVTSPSVYHFLEYKKSQSTSIMGKGVVLTHDEVRTIYAAARHAVETHEGEVEGAVLFAEAGFDPVGELDVVAETSIEDFCE